WYALCRALGYPPAHIRVLTSPEIARPELEGASAGPATASAIREGVKWLAEKLAASGRPGGLLTYSGHGPSSPERRLLCPSDVKAAGDGLENAVNLVELQALLAAHDAGRGLTVVLDCCHVNGDGGGREQRVSTSLRGRAEAAGQPIVAPLLGERMFLASE